jgi:MFS family permease
MTVVNIALPHIQASLHFSATSLSWVLTGYTLTSGGLLLLGGRAGDILGRRRTFVAGIGLFTLASLVGGLAGDAGVLVAARAVQGVGGALASPAVLALIVTSFPEGRERTRALGIYMGVITGGSSLGLVLGGVPAADSGAASGLVNMLQLVGGALGLGVLVAVYGTAVRPAAVRPLAGLTPGAQAQHVITHGIATAFGFAAILNVCSLLVIITLIRGSRLAPAPAPAPREQEEAIAS